MAIITRTNINGLLEHNRNYLNTSNNGDINLDLYTYEEIQFNKNNQMNVMVIKNDNNAMFRRQHPMGGKEIYDKIKSIPISEIIKKYNAVICGGYLCRHIMNKKIHPRVSDIDIFIIDNEPNSNKSHISRRIDDMINDIREHYGNMYDDPSLYYKVYYNKRIVSVQFFLHSQLIGNIQIILRVYKNISHILHGFDIPAACIAYNGDEIYFTKLGKFAYEHRSNILDLSRRSYTYEKRLIKYFELGFDIILPDCKFDISREHGYTCMYLPFLTIIGNRTSSKHKHILADSEGMIVEYYDRYPNKQPNRLAAYDAKCPNYLLYVAKVTTAYDINKLNSNLNIYHLNRSDPTTQQYGIVNPAIITPEQWYGKYLITDGADDDGADDDGADNGIVNTILLIVMVWMWVRMIFGVNNSE